jgi:hypothetical protein
VGRGREVVRDFPLLFVRERGTLGLDQRRMDVVVAWVSGRRRADPWLATEAVGARVGEEVRGTVDWVLDRDGMGIGHDRGQVEGSEVH